MDKDDRVVTIRQIRNVLCGDCAAGAPYIEAEGWYPNMFHDWKDGGAGGRTKCDAFDTVQRIIKICCK